MNVSVRGRLMIMGGTGLALMLAVGGAGYLGLVRSDRAMSDAAVTAEGLRNHLESDMMHDALRGDVYGAMLARTDDEKSQVRADLKEHADHFREMVEANRKLPLGAETSAALASVEPKLEAYISGAEKIVNAALADPASAEPMMPGFTAAFGELETEMERLSDIVQKAQQAAADETAVTVTRSERQMLGIAAFAFAVMSLLLWFVQRSIIRPLSECVRVLGFVAEGDLTQRTNVSGNDELASLARSTNNAADTMEQLVSEIVSASTRVASTSTEIVASANDTAEGMGKQLDQVRQIAAAVEEMTASVAEVARQSTEATKTSTESGRVASEGGKTVNATILDMQSINEAVSAGTASVTQLGKRSEEIGRIIEVINDIADQTNLLALNAAIEAARAGEHGRGFAVVADEVRKLADRTTKATDEIAQSIRAIQTETGEAVRRMEGGTEQVRAGVERAMSAGASLSQIVAGAGEVARMIQSIAAAADEQSAASEEISRSISAISLTAEGAKHAVQAAGQLSQQAETLRTLTTRFKLSRAAT